MKQLAIALLCLVAAWPSWAQDDPIQGLPSANAERERIAAEQAQAKALYDAQEAACYDRFAVNHCLKDVQSWRHATQADLQRQETSLHDSERLQKGAEQLRLLEQKAQERKQKELQAQQAHSEGQAAVTLQAPKQAPLPQTAAFAPADSRQESPGASGPSLAEQARNRESYAAKQAEAEKKRQEIAKRLQGKANKPVPRLPAPD